MSIGGRVACDAGVVWNGRPARQEKTGGTLVPHYTDVVRNAPSNRHEKQILFAFLYAANIY